jgi:hypothetical protein
VRQQRSSARSRIPGSGSRLLAGMRGERPGPPSAGRDTSSPRGHHRAPSPRSRAARLSLATRGNCWVAARDPPKPPRFVSSLLFFENARSRAISNDLAFLRAARLLFSSDRYSLLLLQIVVDTWWAASGHLVDICSFNNYLPARVEPRVRLTARNSSPTVPYVSRPSC